METVQIKMFGDFSALCGGNELMENASRLNKPQEFLAMVLQKRGSTVSNEDLMDCLWEESEIANPAGALKNTAYTLRRQLQRKSPNVEFILTEGSSYCWNPLIPINVDLWSFEETAAQAKSDAAMPYEKRLDLCRKAIGFYSGDFLPALSSRQWVIQRSGFLRETCISVVCRLGDLLLESGRREDLEEAFSLCSRAVMMDPLCGDLYRILFRVLQALGRKSFIRSYYPAVSSLFLDGPEKSLPEEVRNIYLAAAAESGKSLDDINRIRKDLDDTAYGARPLHSAFCCPYQTFKQMYQMVARSASRSKTRVALILLTLVGEHGCPVPRNKLSQAMLLLKTAAQNVLRKGDVFSCYSRNQYVLMLSVRKPEDCSVVELRLRDAFQKQKPPLGLTLDVVASVPEPIL